ncbi:hypothetical protein MCHI_001035, partial [Candidatus Magnetoovum chiemensis]
QEFDVYALAGDYVFLNSTKSTLKPEYVDRFVEDIASFRMLYPEYKDKPLIGILASLYVDPSVLTYAERQGFIVISVGDEIMEVKNSKGFKAKLW